MGPETPETPAERALELEFKRETLQFMRECRSVLAALLARETTVTVSDIQAGNFPATPDMIEAAQKAALATIKAEELERKIEVIRTQSR